MNAMILAAGRGTRLGVLGRARPKILVELDGEPLLARQIRYLSDQGIAQIVINAHHLAFQIECFVAGHPRAADIQISYEPVLLGTAGAVRKALRLLGNDPFVVLYGDVLVDQPIGALLDTHRRAEATGTITLYESEEVQGKGTVEIAQDQLVTAFHEKAAPVCGGRAYVNAGLYLLDPQLLAALPCDVPLDFGHDVFPAALARGERIVSHMLAAPVIDIGTPAALARARSLHGA